MKSQTLAILRHLKAGKTITPIQALEKFGCFRLGARIWDLRKDGKKIITIPVKKNGKHFAKYKLVA